MVQFKLTRRFALLRSKDGEPVGLEQLKARLADERGLAPTGLKSIQVHIYRVTIRKATKCVHDLQTLAYINEHGEKKVVCGCFSVTHGHS